MLAASVMVFYLKSPSDLGQRSPDLLVRFKPPRPTWQANHACGVLVCGEHSLQLPLLQSMIRVCKRQVPPYGRPPQHTHREVEVSYRNKLEAKGPLGLWRGG